MKTVTLGSSEIAVTRLAYGCMRIAGAWDPKEVTAAHIEAGERALAAAYDAGYTLFDHADIYSQGVCERIHRDFLKKSPSLRRQTVVATKCGIRFPGDPHPG